MCNSRGRNDLLGATPLPGTARGPFDARPAAGAQGCRFARPSATRTGVQGASPAVVPIRPVCATSEVVSRQMHGSGQNGRRGPSETDQLQTFARLRVRGCSAAAIRRIRTDSSGTVL